MLKLRTIVFMIAVSMMITVSAKALNADEIIDQLWSDQCVPIILEDDGGTLLIETGTDGIPSAGDIVVGAVNLPRAVLGGASIASVPITDIAGNFPSFHLGNLGNNSVGVIVLAQISSIDVNGVVTMTNVSDATLGYTFTDPDDPNEMITIGGFNHANSIAQIWEDATPEAMDFLDASEVFANIGAASGDSLLGEVGMTGDVDEFYNVTLDAGLNPLSFEMNLNFTESNFARGVLPNQLSAVGGDGCEMYAEGDYTGTIGSFAIHDGDFKVLFVPEPCTMMLLGLGGLVMLRRRR